MEAADRFEVAYGSEEARMTAAVVSVEAAMARVRFRCRNHNEGGIDAAGVEAIVEARDALDALWKAAAAVEAVGDAQLSQIAQEAVLHGARTAQAKYTQRATELNELTAEIERSEALHKEQEISRWREGELHPDDHWASPASQDDIPDGPYLDEAATTDARDLDSAFTGHFADAPLEPIAIPPAQNTQPEDHSQPIGPADQPTDLTPNEEPQLTQQPTQTFLEQTQQIEPSDSRPADDAFAPTAPEEQFAINPVHLPASAVQPLVPGQTDEGFQVFSNPVAAPIVAAPPVLAEKTGEEEEPGPLIADQEPSPLEPVHASSLQPTLPIEEFTVPVPQHPSQNQPQDSLGNAPGTERVEAHIDTETRAANEAGDATAADPASNPQIYSPEPTDEPMNATPLEKPSSYAKTEPPPDAFFTVPVASQTPNGMFTLDGAESQFVTPTFVSSVVETPIESAEERAFKHDAVEDRDEISNGVATNPTVPASKADFGVVEDDGVLDAWGLEKDEIGAFEVNETMENEEQTNEPESGLIVPNGDHVSNSIKDPEPDLATFEPLTPSIPPPPIFESKAIDVNEENGETEEKTRDTSPPPILPMMGDLMSTETAEIEPPPVVPPVLGSSLGVAPPPIPGVRNRNRQGAARPTVNQSLGTPPMVPIPAPIFENPPASLPDVAAREHKPEPNKLSLPKKDGWKSTGDRSIYVTVFATILAALIAVGLRTVDPSSIGSVSTVTRTMGSMYKNVGIRVVSLPIPSIVQKEVERFYNRGRETAPPEVLGDLQGKFGEEDSPELPVSYDSNWVRVADQEDPRKEETDSSEDDERRRPDEINGEGFVSYEFDETLEDGLSDKSDREDVSFDEQENPTSPSDDKETQISGDGDEDVGDSEMKEAEIDSATTAEVPETATRFSEDESSEEVHTPESSAKKDIGEEFMNEGGFEIQAAENDVVSSAENRFPGVDEGNSVSEGHESVLIEQRVEQDDDFVDSEHTDAEHPSESEEEGDDKEKVNDSGPIVEAKSHSTEKEDDISSDELEEEAEKSDDSEVDGQESFLDANDGQIGDEAGQEDTLHDVDGIENEELTGDPESTENISDIASSGEEGGVDEWESSSSVTEADGPVVDSKVEPNVETKGVLFTELSGQESENEDL